MREVGKGGSCFASSSFQRYSQEYRGCESREDAGSISLYLLCSNSVIIVQQFCHSFINRPSIVEYALSAGGRASLRLKSLHAHPRLAVHLIGQESHGEP
jgi:hypothetical protein